MALIGMVVYATFDNKKDWCLNRTLAALRNTVNFNKHDLILSVNALTEDTVDIIDYFRPIIKQVIYNGENIGTARGLNRVMQLREPGQHFVKIDDDIVINNAGWVDELEEAIERDPKIGICGLKRKDLIQSTWHPDPEYRSELIMLPHQPGERWINVEKTQDIIGSCTMFNSKLVDAINYSYQPSTYGFEDVLYSHRSRLAGFYNCFLNHINIDHIDQGGTSFQTWKEKHSGEYVNEMIKTYRQYLSGERSINEPFY